MVLSVPDCTLLRPFLVTPKTLVSTRYGVLFPIPTPPTCASPHITYIFSIYPRGYISLPSPYFASTYICWRRYVCIRSTSMILHCPNQPRFLTPTNRRLKRLDGFDTQRYDTARHGTTLHSTPPDFTHPALFYIIRTKTPPSLRQFFHSFFFSAPYCNFVSLPPLSSVYLAGLFLGCCVLSLASDHLSSCHRTRSRLRSFLFLPPRLVLFVLRDCFRPLPLASLILTISISSSHIFPSSPASLFILFYILHLFFLFLFLKFFFHQGFTIVTTRWLVGY